MTASTQVALEGEVAGEAELPDAIHGGSVVLVGAHPVEVVVAKNGVVQAYPFGDGIDVKSQVVARVNTPKGVQPVTLVWNPQVECFVGRIDAPAPGPVVLQVDEAGTRYEARAEAVMLAPPSAIVVAPAPAVVVEAPAPRAVVVEAPAPRAVVVDGPAPVVVGVPTLHVDVPPPPSIHIGVGGPVYGHGHGHVHGKMKRHKVKRGKWKGGKGHRHKHHGRGHRH